MKKKKITSIVNEGDRIRFDGVIVDGCALVDESSYTGVSKPVLLDNTPGKNIAIARTQIVDGWFEMVSLIEAQKIEGQTKNIDFRNTWTEGYLWRSDI